MKTRLATLTAILATATLALTACAGGSGSTTAQSEQTTQEASASSTRTTPTTRATRSSCPKRSPASPSTRSPIESTYLAYFDGKAPYLVGMSAARVKAMSQTIAAEMAPEMMQVDTSYYDKGEPQRPTALREPDVDVVFYNAFNKEHGEMFRKAGIRPSASRRWATLGDLRGAGWLLEDVFNEDGHMADKIALGKDLVADARARTAKVPEDHEGLDDGPHGRGRRPARQSRAARTAGSPTNGPTR